VFFAPKLWAARLAYAIGDPAKAVVKSGQWMTDVIKGTNTLSEADKALVLRQAKEKAYVAGTMLSLLAANDGMLKSAGSKQRVNFTNPRKDDFLAFKAFGKDIKIVSSMLTDLRFLVNIYHASQQARSGSEVKDSRFEEEGALVMKYGRGKLSPFGQIGADYLAQGDYQNRPMPWSKDKVPAYLAREGKDRYTYPEYGLEMLAPIPVEDAIKEVWSDQGMSNERIEHWLGVLATIAVEGGTGARVSQATDLIDKPAKEPSKRRAPADYEPIPAP